MGWAPNWLSRRTVSLLAAAALLCLCFGIGPAVPGGSAAGAVVTAARIAVPLARGFGGEGSGGIVLIDPSGRRLATLTRPRAGREDSEPAWSPDGKWLAFTRTTDGRRSFQIYVMRASGSGVRRITRGRFDYSPAWSPDGKWIAYTSNGLPRVVRPDGTGDHAVPTRRPALVGWPSWAPGGANRLLLLLERPAGLAGDVSSARERLRVRDFLPPGRQSASSRGPWP